MLRASISGWPHFRARQDGRTSSHAKAAAAERRRAIRVGCLPQPNTRSARRAAACATSPGAILWRSYSMM